MGNTYLRFKTLISVQDAHNRNQRLKQLRRSAIETLCNNIVEYGIECSFQKEATLNTVVRP